MTRTTQGMLALIFFLLATVAADAGVLYARRPGTETPVYNLRISNIRTTVDITGQLAVTHVDEEFFNDNHLVLEGFYAFQLPEGAKVDGLWLWVDGNRLTFIVKTKEEAQRLYDSVVVGQRRDPAILESLGNNRFQLKVFPINPRSSRRIEIRYFHTLPMTPDGKVHYRYPLNLTGYQSEPVERTELRVNVRSLQHIEELGTNFDGNPLLCRTQQLDAFRYRVDFGLEQQMYTQDFELSYLPQDAFTVFPALSYTEPDAGEYPYFICWHPVREEGTIEQPRDLLFVLDASGSMYGERVKTVAAAVTGILLQLKEQDRFRIILFSTTALSFPSGDGLLDATQENIADGIDFVERMYMTGGSTNYEVAFRSALQAEFRSDALRRMLFLTDGMPNSGVTTTEGLLSIIRDNDPFGVAIFPVIMYSDRIEQLYDIAEDRGGKVTMVEAGDDLQTVISRIMLDLNIGGVLSPSITYESGNPYYVYPEDFSNVLSLDKLITTGRLRGLGPEPVLLSYHRGGGEQVDVRRSVDFSGALVDVRQVASYWAAAHIDLLLKQYARDKNPEDKQSIIDLSIKHQILTPFTAFLVLETNQIDPPITSVGTTAAAGNLEIGQNYPNPFSLASGASTVIPFQLKSAASVRIVVTDILGRVVRVLEDAERLAGSHTVRWDGRDEMGRLVCPGMYFVRLHSAGAMVMMKMTVMQ